MSPFSPPREGCGAFAMIRRLAEEAAIEHGAAEPQLQIVLPREADAAVELRAFARGAVEEIREMSLGQRRVPLGLIMDAIEGMRRVPPQRQRRLEIAGEVGQLMLDRLERTDRLTELHALERIAHRGLEATLGTAECIGREQHRARIERAGKRPRTAAKLDGGTVAKGDGGEPPRPVDDP